MTEKELLKQLKRKYGTLRSVKRKNDFVEDMYSRPENEREIMKKYLYRYSDKMYLGGAEK